MSPNMGYSPYEMTFLRKPLDLHQFDFDPERSPIKAGKHEYMVLMQQRLKVSKAIIAQRRNRE